MTTAEAALRQLLADVEAGYGAKAMSSGPLFGCQPHFLRYLEKLARDGLAYHGSAGTWRPAASGWGVCTFWGPRGRCLSAAVHKNGTQGACKEHAVAMGAKVWP